MTQAKYLKIARIIKNRIQDGTYAAHSPLPDQEALAQELGVSRLTVKKALDGLERKGLVYKESGLGTFVLGKIPIQEDIDAPANGFYGLQEQLGKDHITSEIIHFSIEFPDDEIQKNLRIKNSDPVYNIVRLRRLDTKPFILEHTYMPVKLVPNLDYVVVNDSIYEYLHKKLGLKFGVAYRKIRACKPSKDDIQFLEAKKNDPMLELEQIIWLSNGQPIEYSKSRNRYDERNYVILETKSF